MTTQAEIRLVAFDRARQLHPTGDLDALLPIAARIAAYLFRGQVSPPVLTASVRIVFAAPKKESPQ